MKKFTRNSIFTLLATAFVVTISGCLALGQNIGSTAAADQGNAIKVEYRRSIDESLNDFENFIEERNMEVTTKENNSIAASGGFSIAERGENGQDIRMKAVAENNDGSTSLIVIVEYLDPSSGEYKRANNNTGVVTSREEVQTVEARTFMRVKRNFISRYGGDNVEAIDSDLTY